MKQLRTMFIVFFLTMGGLYLFIGYLAGSLRFDRRDMVEYNDKMYRITEDYLAGKSAAEIEKTYGCRLILSGQGSNAELTTLQSSYALVMDFAPEGDVIGKVCWNDYENLYDNSRKATIKTLQLFWLILLVCGTLLLLAVDYYLIRPSRELRNYAGEIAKGNLDVSLPIRKHNPFGNFAEGFDLMREELRNAKEREAAAEKAKKELVAELAHDIKTPVATIIATCEVLEAKGERKLSGNPGDEETKDILEKVDIISHKAETIHSLMDNVFQTTLEELSHIEVNPQEESTETIEAYFRNLKNYGKIILENSIPQCLVYMDRLRMEQVIDNLVGNSKKYADTDIRVRFDEVETASEESLRKYVRIRISDSGPGVPEEELPLITEKYYRGSSVKDKAGFGLGLYLVKTYMERQGGGMECYNDDGFTVELYLRKV